MKRAIYLSIALPLLILLSKPLGSTRACGWGPEELFYGFSFFDPAMTAQPDYSPLFLSFDRFYDLSWTEDDFRYRDNITEWQDFFQGKPTREDIAHIVYKESVDHLIEAKKLVDKESNELPEELKTNSLIQYWQQKKMSSPICYLVYAKQLEPHVTGEYDAWEPVERNPEQMESLIGEGIERYDACKNQFLKMRYGYQVVRLAHYAGKMDDCIRLHDEMVEPLKDKVNSEIYYWSLGHKAGALKTLGQQTEAAYLFSIVFENSPAKRVPSWLSFSIQSDEEWEAVMALCQSQEEKANLYFMRAIDPVSQVIEEIESIYAINPKSEKLDILLAREINKLEYDFFGWDYDFEMPLKTDYNGQSKEKALTYLQELKKLVYRYNREGKVSNTDLWLIAQGYLAFMESDFGTASRIFKNIAAQNQGKSIATYASLFQWVVSVSQLKQISLETEEKIWNDLEKLQIDSPDHELREKANRYLQNVFARRYKIQSDIGKAFLCTRDLDLLYVRPSLELANDMLNWLNELESRKPTSFEAYLLDKLGNQNRKALVQEIIGTMHLKSGNIEDAIATFEQIPNNVRQEIPHFSIGGDPFKAQIVDCLECETDEPGSYDKLSFARKIQSLIKESEESPEKAAENYFQVGNAFYNMTYFGHAWSAAGYFRSGSSWYAIGADEDHWAYQDLSTINLDVQTAEKWYQKSLDVNEGQRELAAQTTYMAAKCEQNRFFLDGYNHDEHLEIKMKDYRSRFDQLIDNYSDTEYYQKVIKECFYLENYKWMQDN
jgi:hypothetical protein